MTNPELTRACSRCGERKPLTSEYFNSDARLKTGFIAMCKVCKAKYLATHYELNAERKKANTAKHRKEKPDVIRDRNAAYREANPDKSKEWSKKTWHKHKEKYRPTKEAYRDANKDAIRERQRVYAQANKEKINAKCAAWSAEKRKSDPMFRVRLNIGRAIRHRLFIGVKSGRHVFDLLGYSPDDLRAHLERQFVKGMTWENYGEWHIDHVVPCVSFDIKAIGDSEFMACWALGNLRPLWATENLRKKDSIIFLL